MRRWPEVARWLSWGAKRLLGAEADVAHPLPGWRDGCDPAAAPQTALSPERSGHRGAGRSALEEARGSAGPRRERHPAPSTFWMGTPRQGLGAAAAILMKPVYPATPAEGGVPHPFHGNQAEARDPCAAQVLASSWVPCPGQLCMGGGGSRSAEPGRS